MKRLLSSFLTIVMVIGILASVPIAVSAADIETLVPGQEVEFSWVTETVYANIAVDETGYYDVALSGNSSYGKYNVFIESEYTAYGIGPTSSDGLIAALPYTYSNVYLEAGVDYTIQLTCYDDEYNYVQGELSVLLTKNDYTVKALSSSSQKLVVDENEIHWFTIETQAEGDYWIDFGAEAFAGFYNYYTGEFVNYCFGDLNTLRFDADTKYLVEVYYQNANAQPVYASFGAQEKTINYIELYNAVCLGDDYLYGNRYYYDYLVTYTDGSNEVVDYDYFEGRGVTFDIYYAGEYTDEQQRYMCVGDQPVEIFCSGISYLSYIYVQSYVDFVSDLDPVTPDDDMYIEYEDNEYKQYFWRINVYETGMYDLYSYDGWQDTFEYYNIEFFDENNNAAYSGTDGWALEEGKEYSLMMEYYYNEGVEWDFEFTLAINPDHVHTSSSWITDKKASVYSADKKHKECTECGAILETAKIPQLKCSKPTLKKISNTEYGVKVTWNEVKGADSYRVYRKTSKGEWTYIGSTTKTGYTDKTAKSGTKYYYAVRARNEAGNSSLSSSLSKFYLDNPTMKTPSSTKSGVKLTWTKTGGAQGYMVYRKTEGGSYSRIATVKGSAKVTYTDSSAKKGKKYYYKVKAYYSKTYSAYSNTKSVTDKY